MRQESFMFFFTVIDQRAERRYNYEIVKMSVQLGTTEDL